MHEMAIAEGVLDIALDYAKQNDAKCIREIGLLIGDMSGVVVDSLTFSFDMIAKGTLAEGAEIKVKHVPLVGRSSILMQRISVDLPAPERPMMP